MLIKIAIFTIIGLSAVALSWFWGPGLWRKFQRNMLGRELTKISGNREYFLSLQRILELPDAYERLLVEGIVYYRGIGEFTFVASPSATAVRHFIEANKVSATNATEHESVPFLLRKLQDQEDQVRAELYVIAARDKPANRDPHLIEQRSKIEQLEHQLTAERKQLEKLEAQDRSPDPYGRIPKMRLERYVPMDAAEPKEAPHSRKKRA